MDKRFLSGRISVAIYDELDRYCQKYGQNKTQVMQDALVSYLKIDLPPSQVSRQEFESLCLRVQALESPEDDVEF